MGQNYGQVKDPSNPVNLDEQQLQELENLIAGLKKGIIVPQKDRTAASASTTDDYNTQRDSYPFDGKEPLSGRADSWNQTTTVMMERIPA